MQEQIVSVKYNGTSLALSANIEAKGDDWLVCLHGLQSNKALFKGLLEQPFLKNYSTLALDLVGFGRSVKPTDFNYTVETQAQVVENCIKQLKLPRVTLLGHSLGGMVSIFLLNPLKGVVSAIVNMEGNLVLSDCGPSKDVANTDFVEFQRHGFKSLKSNVAEESPQRLAWLELIPDYVFYNMSRSIVQVSKSENLVRLFGAAGCRSLFVYGDKNYRKVEAVPDNVSSQSITNSGHFMLQDNPEECYACLNRFLNHDGRA